MDTAALALARGIVAVIIPPERRQEITEGLMRAIIAQMRDAMVGKIADAGLRQILDDYLRGVPERLRPITDQQFPLIIEAMAKAYVHQFSLDELKQINAFAQTPAGAHYLSRSTAIMSDPDVAAANRTYFTAAMQANRGSEAELRTTIANYYAKHPELAQKMRQAAQQP